MKRTTKQVNNIKKGCEQRDNSHLIEAQKKRHLKAKINERIITALKRDKHLDNCKNWAYKLELITTTISLRVLLEEIENELEERID